MRRPLTVRIPRIRALLATLAAVVGVISIASIACLERAPEPHAIGPDSLPAEVAVNLPADPGAQVVETAIETVRERLRRGESPDGLLERVGLDRDERLSVITALDGPLDLRRLQAGTGLTVRRASDGVLLSLAVRPEANRFVRLVPADGGWAATWRDLPVEVTVRTAGGVVTASVAQALAHEHHARPLVPAFADIFQWDVDLLVDPRPGDRVRIVYEVHRLGAIDDDTPPFRDLPEAPGDEVGLGRILAASYDGRLARSEAYWVEDDAQDGDYYDVDGVPLRKAFLRSPLNYRRISSGFSRGRMHPVLRRVVPHHGVDFAAAAGTPVVAAADGRVSSVGWDGALGKTIRVRHGNGFETVYGHLRGYARGIRAGASVEQNQVIGYVGATGRATGPHLHYTMLVHGKAIDPLRFDNPPVEPLPERLGPSLQRSLRLWTPILASIRPDDDGSAVAGSDASANPDRG